MKEATEYKPFPEPMKFFKLLGPSFLILATGLGSGEIILWPYLASHFGMGLAWLALLGITFQYFINMEIERYSLVKGESVFVGMNRIMPWAPYWLAISTFLTFAIPGTASAAAQLFGEALGLTDFRWLGIGVLILIGLIVSIGKTVYKTLEWVMKIGLMILIPSILGFVIYVSTTADWAALASGLVGVGDGYLFVPSGVALAALLGAFAYSGSGGNLNLAQSSYIQEKNYGMGKYAPKIQSLFSKKVKKEKISLVGLDFKLNKTNMRNFKIWWRRISLEHLLIFWFLGLFMLLLFMLLAHITIYGQGAGEGINFVINQSIVIGQTFFPWMGPAFLVFLGIFLFQSQLGIYDSASRIISENYAVKVVNKTNKRINLSKIYHMVIWVQIALGSIFFLTGYYEPKSLIILAAVLNAVGMFVHIGLVNWLNFRTLRKEFQASLIRKILMILIFIVFGIFSIITIFSYLI